MDPHTKDKIQYGTAVTTLLSGIFLCYVAFFRSKDGDVPDGALWYFGQTLVYAATIFGFKLAVDEIKKNK
jgi:hypothetical protein